MSEVLERYDDMHLGYYVWLVALFLSATGVTWLALRRNRERAFAG